MPDMPELRFKQDGESGKHQIDIVFSFLEKNGEPERSPALHYEDFNKNNLLSLQDP